MSQPRPAHQLFQGIGVALVSLFDEREQLLVDETAHLAAQLVTEGVRAIVLAGTTGESWSLTTDERESLTHATRAAVPADIPVIVGTGSSNEHKAARLTAAIRDTGADAVIALSPPGVDDPSSYYESVAEAAGDLPVLGYHFPDVSPPGIAVRLLDRLPIVGLKDSSGDAERLVTELDAREGSIYVGNPMLLALAGTLGADGAILGLANYEVARCAAAFAGDLEAQRDLVSAHLAARHDFPRALKQMVAERRGTPAAVRTRSDRAATSV